MKTVLSGTHQPDQPQPKRSRRSPKKRRAEKSEVATPEFGTISLDKPGLVELTNATNATNATNGTIGTNATATTTGIRKSVKPASDNSCHVPYTDYRRELPAARDRRRRWIDQQVNEAMRAGFAIGVVTGMIIAGGICWLVASLL